MSPLLLALLVASAERTTLTLDAPVPGQPRYSQSVTITAHLRKSDGTPVAGTDCAPACSVTLKIAKADDLDHPVVINGQGFVTDSNGDTSGAGIIFVDGNPASDTHWSASTAGVPYVISARFLGTDQGLIIDNPDCDPANPEGAANGLCPSEDTVDVSLFAETSKIVLGQGLEASLGESFTLSAEVSDPNGNSDGSDVDGPGPLDLAGVNVQFFYDVNGDGNASEDESVGTAPTNSAGVASIELVLDPLLTDAGGRRIFHAGSFHDGVQAEYSGDDHFGVARAAADIVVHPADIDVSKTVLEAEPDSIPADGFSKSTIRVRLVDSFNNPLDENSDPHTVVLSTNLGTLNDKVERDVLDGTYTQVLQAQRKGGTATVTVTVDDVKGPSKDVEIVGGKGCSCGSFSDMPMFLVGLLFLRRRFGKSQR